MDGLWRKTPFKWMIWGYHDFWKHPYTHISAVATASKVCSVIFFRLFGIKVPCFTLSCLHLNPYPLSYVHMGEHLQKMKTIVLLNSTRTSITLAPWKEGLLWSGLELWAMTHQHDPSAMFLLAACEVHLGLLFLETTQVNTKSSPYPCFASPSDII